ncbi:tRNA (cytidine(56)-2'-O)-methyltransferase [Halobacteriales archaeon QS_8_69_26]|nr:MAG: tRNA (cytidine(56)-2'-O)-methyltransferase [Halobacteriales archaeon QS_8_69_26]
MEGHPEVTVLRLGHRPGRDERMTTHVALTARALGADRAVLEPAASGSADTVRDITDRFGGPFAVEVADAPKGRIRSWDGVVAHLTMYGLPVQEVMGEVRAAHFGSEAGSEGGAVDDGDPADDGEESGPEAAGGSPLLVVVGGGKVPFEVYDRAGFNVAVTNQPHSEVAALAVFLDRLFEGRELDRQFEGGDRRVIPEETGKRVEDLE